MSNKTMQTNPLLFNITLKLADAIADKWLTAMKRDILPYCVDGKIIVSSQVNKLQLSENDNESTYAVQFTFATAHIYNSEGLPALDKFLKLLDKQFANQYVYFTTKMEVLHFVSVPSDN